jgi:hypothetical protein
MEEIEIINKLFTDIESKDDNIRFNAFKELLEITENNVSWVYDKWFVLVDKLYSGNSFQRSIGLMLLANLSKSDLENRFETILDHYLEFFEDEKFITSRQCIQNVWKIALSNDFSKKKIIQKLKESYFENINLSKHGNLIKQDIIGSLTQIFIITKDESISELINYLIGSENEEKLIKSLNKIVSSKNNTQLKDSLHRS